MNHTYDEICKCLNSFSGSLYIEQTTAFFFISFFMKVLVLSGAIPETFNLFISRVATNITVGGETPAFQRNLFMLLQR